MLAKNMLRSSTTRRCCSSSGRYFRRFEASLTHGRRDPGSAIALSQSGLRVEHRLELDLDADLLRDQEPATVQRQVPGQAPVLAVDRADGGEDGAMAAPGVGRVAQVPGLQGDRPGDVSYGQHSGEQPSGAMPVGRVPGEGGQGVPGDVEEIRGPEMLVAG